MSSCPHCGASVRNHVPAIQDYPEEIIYECGHRANRDQADSCRIPQLQRELKQANAVIDAINTLMENGRTEVMIGTYPHGRAFGLAVDDAARKWHYYEEADTLRDALERCVTARDQQDREAE